MKREDMEELMEEARKASSIPAPGKKLKKKR